MAVLAHYRHLTMVVHALYDKVQNMLRCGDTSLQHMWHAGRAWQSDFKSCDNTYLKTS